MNRVIPFDTAEQCIHERFEQVATLIPDAPAASDQTRSLSYMELSAESNRMATLILNNLAAARGNVAFVIGNNVFQIITILGILKSGRSYVALDPTFPIDRNRLIYDDSECTMIITTSEWKEVAREISNEAVILMADDNNYDVQDQLPRLSVKPSDNAITLYTSGSTNMPKGVLQSHRNMVHFIKRMSELYPLSPDDKVGYFLNVGFSAHALPLLGAILNGCELVTHDFKSGNFLQFSEWMNRSGITFTMMIPSFLRHFLSIQESSVSFPFLRMLFLGGESLYRSDVEKAFKTFEDDILIVNIYASTEAYLMRSYPIRKDSIITSNIVPIGYPVEGMDIKLVEDGIEVETGKTGEILLSSRYLTEGYQNNIELYEKDFNIDVDTETRHFNTGDMAYEMEDGSMVHIGRKDAVVKLRGFRIDFGEIINLILQAGDVREACCALRKDPQGREHIIAYIVPARSGKLDLDYLRASLVRLLPDYMLPSRILSLEKLPKNAAGKIDKLSLPDPEWEDRTAMKMLPRNETEEKLKNLFEKELKISPIGIEEDFIELGANSLSLFVALSEVEKIFNVKIDIQAIKKMPNIMSLADYIIQNPHEESPADQT